ARQQDEGEQEREQDPKYGHMAGSGSGRVESGRSGGRGGSTMRQGGAANKTRELGCERASHDEHDEIARSVKLAACAETPMPEPPEPSDLRDPARGPSTKRASAEFQARVLALRDATGGQIEPPAGHVRVGVGPVEPSVDFPSLGVGVDSPGAGSQ